MEKRVFRNWLCRIEILTDRERIMLANRYENLEEFLIGKEAWHQCIGKKAERLQLYVETKNASEWGNVIHAAFIRQIERGIFFIHLGEEGYPSKLRTIPDPPLGIFYRGKLPAEEKTIAVIGARDCTPYGKSVAKELGRRLGERKIPVISGMARGVDGIAQEAALLAGGTSYAVLGCGVDICYPRSNQGVYDKLLLSGGILSAYGPGVAPQPILFPPRNRIVSGLSDVIVVVEAGEKSGTLITVDMALEQGREVWAVPGRVTDRLSFGCNRLIAQGAGNLYDISQLLEEFLEETAADKTTKKEVLGDMGIVYNQLDFTPKSVDDLEAELAQRYELQDLNVLLMRLVLEGLAAQPTPGHFCLV